jgi:hypothetical protein
MFSDETQQPKPEETTQPSTPPQQQDLFADKLREITKEDGSPKYRDVETALSALKESQSFIEKLKEENREREERLSKLEQELNSRQSVDEAVERLLGSAQQKPKDDQPMSSGLDAKTVEEMIQRTLTTREKEQLYKNNLVSVETQVAEWYGDKAKEVIATRAKELDMTPKKLGELASENPKLALRLLKDAEVDAPKATKSSQTPPRSVPQDQYQPPEKSLVKGGMTNKELVEQWRKIQEHTNKRLGVET